MVSLMKGYNMTKQNEMKRLAMDLHKEFGDKDISKKELKDFWLKHKEQKKYPYLSCITRNDVFKSAYGKRKITPELIEQAFATTSGTSGKVKAEKTKKVKIKTVASLVKNLGIDLVKTKKTKSIVSKKPKVSKKENPVRDNVDYNEYNGYDHDDGSDLVEYVRSGNLL